MAGSRGGKALAATTGSLIGGGLGGLAGLLTPAPGATWVGRGLGAVAGEGLAGYLYDRYYNNASDNLVIDAMQNSIEQATLDSIRLAVKEAPNMFKTAQTVMKPIPAAVRVPLEYGINYVVQ